MKKKGLRDLAIILAFIFVIGTLGTMAIDAATKKVPPPDYFPLAPGYWWTYKSVDKGWEFTIKVTGKEKIGEYDTYKVETTAANGQVMLIDYYAKVPGKVYYIRTEQATTGNKADFSPAPRDYIHNPLGINDTWSWTGKGMMDVDITETSKVLAAEPVNVPAGKFSAMHVNTDLNQGGADVKKDYWYAPNIGLVQSSTDSGGVKNTMVLIKYNLKAK